MTTLALLVENRAHFRQASTLFSRAGPHVTRRSFATSPPRPPAPRGARAQMKSQNGRRARRHARARAGGYGGVGRRAGWPCALAICDTSPPVFRQPPGVVRPAIVHAASMAVTVLTRRWRPACNNHFNGQASLASRSARSATFARRQEAPSASDIAIPAGVPRPARPGPAGSPCPLSSPHTRRSLSEHIITCVAAHYSHRHLGCTQHPHALADVHPSSLLQRPLQEFRSPQHAPVPPEARGQRHDFVSLASQASPWSPRAMSSSSTLE